MQPATPRNAGPSAPPKLFHTYRLKFFDDGRGVAKEVEFDAFDAAEALIIAHGEASERSAELWCDGEKLCTIRRGSCGAWEIGGSAPRAA